MGITAVKLMALLTALRFAVTGNRTNYCFHRFNVITVTDSKMRPATIIIIYTVVAAP